MTWGFLPCQEISTNQLVERVLKEMEPSPFQSDLQPFQIDNIGAALILLSRRTSAEDRPAVEKAIDLVSKRLGSRDVSSSIIFPELLESYLIFSTKKLYREKFEFEEIVLPPRQRSVERLCYECKEFLSSKFDKKE